MMNPSRRREATWGIRSRGREEVRVPENYFTTRSLMNVDDATMTKKRNAVTTESEPLFLLPSRLSLAALAFLMSLPR